MDHFEVLTEFGHGKQSVIGRVCDALKWLTVIGLLTFIAVSCWLLPQRIGKEITVQRELSEETAASGARYKSFPDGNRVWGVTVLDDELYVLRGENDELEVYDTTTYRLQRRLAIPGITGGNDLASSAACRCIFVADIHKNSVHRITKQGDVFSWPVGGKSQSISVNSRSNVLVTFQDPDHVTEYTSSGTLVRDTRLGLRIANATHAVEWSRDELVVSHGSINDPYHRICIVRIGDGQVTKCYPGNNGSSATLLHYPVRLAVSNGYLVVDDLTNDQVLLLSANLTYVRDLVSRYDGLRSPARMWLDKDGGRLYVGDNEVKNGSVVAGDVKVFDVKL